MLGHGLVSKTGLARSDSWAICHSATPLLSDHMHPPRAGNHEPRHGGHHAARNTPSVDPALTPEGPHERTHMGLVDRIETTPAKIHGKPCSVGALVDKLDTDEAAALHAMLHELGWSQRRIYEALEAEGHIVGEQTINRHRSRACRCYKVEA